MNLKRRQRQANFLLLAVARLSPNRIPDYRNCRWVFTPSLHSLSTHSTTNHCCPNVLLIFLHLSSIIKMQWIRESDAVIRSPWLDELSSDRVGSRWSTYTVTVSLEIICILDHGWPCAFKVRVCYATEARGTLQVHSIESEECVVT